MPETPDLETTARLLTDPVWRQRVVEKLLPLSADHYELRRSFQFEVPPRLVDRWRPGVDTVPALLPVCWLPKEALLDFDVTDVAGRSLAVLERRSIAGVLANVLDGWRSVLPELYDIDLPIESICGASLSPWRQAQDRSRDDEAALVTYLRDATGDDITRNEAAAALDRERGLAKRAYTLLDRSWSDADLDNTLTGAALLVPYLDERPATREALLDLVDSHHEQVEHLLAVASTSPAARTWMWILVEAGLRWPVLVPYRIPVEQPFLVKTREVRPSGDDDPREFRHEADTGTARSFPIEVRSPDPSIRIRETPVAFGDDGSELGAPETFEAMRWTSELFTAYTSRDPKPDRVTFRIRFGLDTAARLPYVFALVVGVAALVAAILLDVDSGAAAVLTIPPALIGGLLVTRDAAIVARFLHGWRRTLVALNVALWLVVIAKLVS